MALLDELLLLMRSTSEIKNIQVLENISVDDETFTFKVRATLEPEFFQIRLLADKDFTRYSFQLYSDKPLLRWDNTPHYPNLDNYPHHFHDENDNVSHSMLTGNLLTDYNIVIDEIRKFIKKKLN